jgi:molecular chaperone DnaK (HSP70)
MYGVLCVVLLPILLVHNTEGAAVISIDLGSEWMKIGIVSPGVPMEIVLNKESKRKTPAVVAFRDGVRTFGEDAVTVGVRFPKNSYKYLLDLLGKPYDHPLVQDYRLVLIVIPPFLLLIANFVRESSERTFCVYTLSFSLPVFYGRRHSFTIPVTHLKIGRHRK